MQGTKISRLIIAEGNFTAALRARGGYSSGGAAFRAICHAASFNFAKLASPMTCSILQASCAAISQGRPASMSCLVKHWCFFVDLRGGLQALLREGERAVRRFQQVFLFDQHLDGPADGGIFHAQMLRRIHFPIWSRICIRRSYSAPYGKPGTLRFSLPLSYVSFPCPCVCGGRSRA